MCRLLGIVSREPRRFSRCLREAPRSLAVLGREHGDGWGIATHAICRGWRVTKQMTSACDDPAFHVAAQAEGSVLVAHVRKRTVGRIALENTHPFQHARWIFAHNGTIERREALRTVGASARITTHGETDSEELFAFLLERLPIHRAEQASRSDVTGALERAVAELVSIPSLGTATFLLSDGEVLYAYRSGRPLFLLERRNGTNLEAVLVASEPVTEGEPWTEVADGTLLGVGREPALGCAATRPA
ncbi:MAG TPA: class II glutamine amidotransferase [Polyangiaceae bacterium]|nr:class II glutamine amidotransferase [Polyangiaceae bacterium]